MKAVEYRDRVIVAHPLSAPLEVYFDDGMGSLMCRPLNVTDVPAGIVPTFDDDRDREPA